MTEQNNNAPKDKPTHTSVSRLPVVVPKYDLSMDAMERVCEVTQVRGGGPGGQHRNKAYTGARILHIPSGVAVTATERRSFQMNRAAAFERLIEKLAALMVRPVKRKKTRVPKGVKRKRLKDKKKRGETKKNRSKKIRRDDW